MEAHQQRLQGREAASAKALRHHRV